MDQPARRLALSLSGGGARAAYQVGLLRSLAQRYPDLRPHAITGVSAGAINAVCLAAHPGGFAAAAERLEALWGRLTVDRVFRTDARSLLGHVLRWGFRLVSGGGALAPEVRGLVDTEPLRELLRRELAAPPGGAIPGIAANLEAGRLGAVALTTSNLGTGQSITWVQGSRIEGWERPDRRSRNTRLTVDHVMASAALPVFFPAVAVDGDWHADGGIRLTAPLSPAMHLGADRILAVSTRHRRTFEEADRSAVRGYPPPLQIASQLLNAIFLDVLDQDALRLERINALLRHLPPEHRGGLQPVELVVIRPSRDLGRLAGDFEVELPRIFRHFVRSLGSRETASPDLLSLLMFEGPYLQRLIALGEEDGEAEAERIAALVEG